ncbi:MAG: AraC family transcriptional regulator [Planctomycetota bacterium]|nr:MAG: AraC family transcriptional regulator [Planctomycetota bacterium]
MAELPVIFQDKDKVYYADTCERLKQAAKQNEIYLRAWSRGSYPGERLPRKSLTEVRSIGIWDAAHNQSWGLDLHCNEGIELTYLARGKAAFEVDGRTWILRKGHVTITRPWQFHRVGNPNVTASRLYWLILDVNVRRPNQSWRWPEWLICSQDDLNQLTRLLRHNEQPVWPADGEITRCFAKLADLLEHRQPNESETKLKLYINELIIAVMEMLQRKQIPLDAHLSTSQRAVEMFLTALSEHVDHDWNLNGMADQCGLSRSQFSTYCKQITNMTPIEYLTHCRLEVAAKLLQEHPEMSITEVAFACGFNSSQYFATIFQFRNGCSPSDFRSQYTYPEAI